MTTTGSAATDPLHPDVIHVQGDIDMASVSCLTEAIDGVIRGGDLAPVLVLDCANLTFIDSMGLSALVRANDSLLAAGSTLTLRNVPERASKLLELTQLDQTLRIESAHDDDARADLTDA